MKKQLSWIGLTLVAFNVMATNAFLDLADSTLNAGPYYTNRTIWLQSLSTPTINSPAVVLSAKLIVTNDANGQYTWTNLFPGLYIVTVKAPPSQDQFAFWFDSTNLGTINISDYLVANSTATFPAGSVAWAAAVTDLRYARTTNVNITFQQVSNALGYVPQFGSANLTNWNFFTTNILNDIPHYQVQQGNVNLTNWGTLNTNVLASAGTGTSTNAVLGIGSTNWVAMNAGGSTNQALLNPTSTNLVNRGNAVSSLGTANFSEQFGAGATATAISATALGAGSSASFQGATAVGQNVVAGASAATSVGQNSFATGSASTALGNFASASAQNATAIGENAVVTHANSTAIGQNAVSRAAHEVSIGSSGDTFYFPGNGGEIVGGVTNDTLTAFGLVGTDNNKKLIGVTVGSGLAYDGGTISVLSSGTTYQAGSQNLTNWSQLQTNVLSNKTGTNDVIGIGNTNWVRTLNGGSTNQVLLNASSTNLVNYGNALHSQGASPTDDQFGLSASASGTNATALGYQALAQGQYATALGSAASAQGSNTVAVGAGALALTPSSIALGFLSQALHNGSTVVGPGATSTRINQVTIGSGEEVNIPGKLVVAGGLTNTVVGANKVVITDVNNRETGGTLGNGLTVSGTTLSLNTDSTLSTSGGSLSVVGSALTGLNASSAFSSGTVPTARLGSGTANSSTVLHGDSTWGSVGLGSVTSVGLSMPAEFSVASSPVTSSGTIAVTKANESANLVFAGPTTGAAAAPTFRSLVAADVPSLTGSYWSLSGNLGGGNFLGTTDTTPLVLKAHNVTVGSFTEVSAMTKVTLGDAATHSILGLQSGILSGSTNYIGTSANGSVIAGGVWNTNSAQNSLLTSGATISGGVSNTITPAGAFGTIPGGFMNFVDGRYSYAAGRRASAQNFGQFVWADSQDADFVASVADSFNVRAQGGVRLTTPSLTINGSPQVILSSSQANDQTTTSTVLAASAISVTLAAGQNYSFCATIFCNDSTANNGVKIDFAGGSASATLYRNESVISDAGGFNSAQQQTALATAIADANITGDTCIRCNGFIKVGSGGTVIIRFAQNSHTTGTLTLYAGSNVRFYGSN